jgi:hypothetical protein
MNMRILTFILIAACFAGAFLGSCRKKVADESPPQSKSQFSDEPTKQKQSATMSISDNPAFFSATTISPKAPEVKDLDNLLRPVLTKLFGEVKLVEESKAPQTKPDGEVVENRMVYVVRLLLTPEEGDNLHLALKGVGFVSSPRLGSKPTHSRTMVLMSLMKSTSLRGYSLVINVDAGRQRIEIESYKLGSKYDRMM